MNALEITNLSKTYKNGFEALKGINITVKEGDFFAMLGPNGAGKSTTLGIITSLALQTAGKVLVFGKDTLKESVETKKSIGLVPQEFNFSIFETPWQIVLNQAGYYGVPRKKAILRATHFLQQLGLWEKRHQQARLLSGGMKRRLMIVRALVHDPKLLILDEPTAGVDIELRRSMWEFLTGINKKGITIILTTHYLEEAESLCHNIAIINQGKIVVNTDKKSLLRKLNTETFILSLKKTIMAAPILSAFPCELIDTTTIAVEVKNTQAINSIFAELTEHHIEVESMRNKSNRLEELFLKLTNDKSNHD